MCRLLCPRIFYFDCFDRLYSFHQFENELKLLINNLLSKNNKKTKEKTISELSGQKKRRREILQYFILKNRSETEKRYDYKVYICIYVYILILILLLFYILRHVQCFRAATTEDYESKPSKQCGTLRTFLCTSFEPLNAPTKTKKKTFARFDISFFDSLIIQEERQ